MNTSLTRRELCAGLLAATAAGGCRSISPTNRAENLSVFMSDIHLSGAGVRTGNIVQPTYQNALFERAVDQVLAMNPRPARVVVFGDLALWVGWSKDYEASLAGFNRLRAAGIDLHLTLGNHDHRKVFLKYHPEYASKSPVPGRITSVIDLGRADLLLLDSLKETGSGEGTPNAEEGDIGAAQWAWLQREASCRTRPFFVGAHHAPEDLGLKRQVRQFLAETPRFAGWLHGHDHRWSERWFHKDWESRRIRRVAALPSTGWWGDIGFMTFETFSDRAELRMAPGNDFFFPCPLNPSEPRPAEWDDIRLAHQDIRCVFRY
ncbi:MAG: metallophosphoesterase [Kiritimatiellia bacterium]